jgi:hypothetical protein
MALGDPAQGEERADHARLREHVQHSLRVALDPALATVPCGTIDDALERANLKPILNVNRQAIEHRSFPRFEYARRALRPRD